MSAIPPENPDVLPDEPDTRGPLTRLLEACGQKPPAPIPEVKPITEMPVRLNPETILGNKPLGDMVPVSHATPHAAICPTCRVFEIQPGSTLCPRCTRRQAIRLQNIARFEQHSESVRRELAEKNKSLPAEEYTREQP